MIQEVIKPQYNNFTIDIPNSYIDKEAEIIENIKQEKKKSLKGIFNQYADNSKISLENNAWKNNIIEKFKKHD